MQAFQKESNTKRILISTRPSSDILKDIPENLKALHCELQPLVEKNQRVFGNIFVLIFFHYFIFLSIIYQ